MSDEESGDYTDDGEVQGEQSAGPCCSCCLGFVLFPAMLMLLAWNENNFVCTNKRILYAQEHAEPQPCDPSRAVPGMGYVSCPVRESSYKTFTPADFNPNVVKSSIPVSFAGLEAVQSVEMYQCQESKSTETRKDSNGNKQTVTKYSYSMVWSSQSLTITSSQASKAQSVCTDLATAGTNPAFPSNLQAGTQTRSVDSFRMGASDASSYLVPSEFYPNGLATTPVDLTSFAPLFSGTAQPAGVWAAPPAVVNNFNLAVRGNYLETCPGQSRLGCVRIAYSVAKPTAVSIIADVLPQARSFQKTKTPASWGCSKGSFFDFREGSIAKDVMIQDLQASNSMMVWFLRLVGVLGAWMSVYCMLSPLKWMADKIGDVAGCIPCIGDFVEGLIEGVAEAVICMISCSFGCSCSFLVIAVVWLYMRPLYGGAFMLISCCCCCAAGMGAKQVMDGRRDKGGMFEE